MDNLIEAYINNTDYIFKCDETEICININIHNQELDNLLEKYNANNIVMISAYNPMSKLTSDDKNAVMHQSLKIDIKKLGLKYFEGENKTKDNSWPSEKSLFVLDLNKEDAIALMEKYIQKGIIIANKGGISELILNDN